MNNRRSIGLITASLFVIIASLCLSARGHDNLRRAEIDIDTTEVFSLKHVSKSDLIGIEFYLSEWEIIPAIIVYENGLRHKNFVIEGFNYKEKYMVGDYIQLLGHTFRITDIDKAKSKVVIIEEPILLHIIYESKHYDVNDYYDEKEYLFIYEWSTDNEESVNLLSKVKKLFKRYGNEVSFLGVCYGDISDYERAAEVWRNNRLRFKMLYIDKSSDYIKAPNFIVLNNPWLNLSVSGQDYLPFVLEEFEEIHKRCSDD